VVANVGPISLSGRMVTFITDLFLVQWPELVKKYSNVECVGASRIILPTVGTQFSFDRLVKAVDDAFDNSLVDEDIFAQIGDSQYKPRNFNCVDFFDRCLFERLVQKASSVISHAGIGVITMALENRKPLLVMPRLRENGEVVNNHQVAIAKRFSELGHILAVYDAKDLPNGIHKLKDFIPKGRKTSPDAVADRIGRFLNSLSKSR